MSYNFKDLSGKIYGRLLVLSISGKRNGTVLWSCLCECGNKKNISTSALNSGCAKSCGCMRNAHKKKTKHGEGRNVTKEYRAWADMKHRCMNPFSKVYKFYGARGISVCQRWAESYETFLEDMGRAPTKKHSLDRYPDKNGNYEPGNCRWATSLQQQNNIRSNRLIEYGGEILSASQWQRRINIHKGIFFKYLREGKTLHDIINLKNEKNLKPATFKPKTL